ncbi:MAG: hypothetical protein WBI18_01590 [Candidatus Saccharicenans sp.]
MSIGGKKYLRSFIKVFFATALAAGAISGLLFSKTYPGQWELTLSIYPSEIYFTPGDPDVEPVTSASGPVRIQIDTWPPKRRWEVTVRAEGNLVNSFGEVIPIGSISWQATPQPPFYNGVLAAGQNQLLGRGRGRGNGEINFYFQNSWSYPSGEYFQVITITGSLI